MTHNFQLGQLYNRRRDIHKRYGGIQQTGISPSAQSPFIFVFTGHLGEKYGYRDDWENGVFKYTGEGKVGDMQFTHGNKALRDHVSDGRDLLLFEQLGKGKPYKFMGEFVCSSYEYKDIPDENGDIRTGIIFHLKNVDAEFIDAEAIGVEERLPIEELRKKAYRLATTVPILKASESQQVYIQRNRAVRNYVFARAQGLCECCGRRAPFKDGQGQPFLEVHHIGKLSDKGMDHPKMMAALTPNCHRRIHYGEDGANIDAELRDAISRKEGV